MYGGGSSGGMYGGGSSATMGQRSRRNRGPKGYTRSDERIREDLSDRLMQDDYLDTSDVEIQVKDAVVTLTGTVHDRSTKYQLEELAERVGGVKDVENQLRVKRDDESGGMLSGIKSAMGISDRSSSSSSGSSDESGSTRGSSGSSASGARSGRSS
jgi:hypothetical protein